MEYSGIRYISPSVSEPAGPPSFDLDGLFQFSSVSGALSFRESFVNSEEDIPFSWSQIFPFITELSTSESSQSWLFPTHLRKNIKLGAHLLETLRSLCSESQYSLTLHYLEICMYIHIYFYIYINMGMKSVWYCPSSENNLFMEVHVVYQGKGSRTWVRLVNRGYRHIPPSADDVERPLSRNSVWLPDSVAPRPRRTTEHPKRRIFKCVLQAFGFFVGSTLGRETKFKVYVFRWNTLHIRLLYRVM